MLHPIRSPLAVCAILVLSAGTLPSPRAAALVVVTGEMDMTDHGAAPPDGRGWNYVANRGVYLGNGWVITASHVGAGDTVLGGTSYAFDGTQHQLTNPPGLRDSIADLVVYRISGVPTEAFAPLAIAGSTPALGAEVTLIGNGATTSTTHPMVQQYSLSAGELHGYSSTTSGKRWGTNLVTDDEQLYGEGDGDNHTVPAESDFATTTVSFLTLFDHPTLEHPDYMADTVSLAEAQAQGGDSGGGVFQLVGGEWVLAGITHAVEIEPDQPGGTSTALYGNYTYIADLSYYRDQILTITAVPELGSAHLAAVPGAIVLGALVVRGYAGHPARRL